MYKKIVVFFLSSKTNDENYKQSFSHYPEFQDYKMNNKRAEAGAIDGNGIMSFNIEELNKKSEDYREFVILEEFCHLLDDNGDSRPKGKELLDFVRRFSECRNMLLVQKMAHDLDENFKHYNVNKLMMKFDFEKWFKFRHSHYGKLLRQRTNGFYQQVTKLHSNELSTAIMIIQILMVISFLRAVESFKNENDIALGLKEKQKLKQIISQHAKTINLLQKYTEQLGLVDFDILSLFNGEVFTDEELYFREINRLWVKLRLSN